MNGENRLLLLTLGFCGVASSLAARSIDPMVSTIAQDLSVPVATVALLSTSYALPYGLGQPFLGPLGDSLGKARVLKACLVVFTIALSVASAVPAFWEIGLARAVAGLAAGGIIPLALAMLGDRFPLETRQVAIGRFLAASVIGQLIGNLAAGLIADLVGWRTAMWFTAIIAMAAMLLAIMRLEDGPTDARRRVDVAAAMARYRMVFANPRALICFGGVFCEGLAVFGVLPFVSELIDQRMDDSGPTEAAFVLAGLATGGILFSLTVHHVLRLLGPVTMMRVGGVICALGLVLFSAAPTWPLASACFLAIGFGFFMIHNSLQNRATELAPSARGSAVSLHAFFFFLGQGLAPVLFGLAFHRLGVSLALAGCACLILLTGFTCAQLLSRQDDRSARMAGAEPASR